MATNNDFNLVIENNLKDVVKSLRDVSLQMSLMTGKMTKSQVETGKWNQTINTGTRVFDTFHGGLINTNRVFGQLNHQFSRGRDLISSYTLGMLGVGFSINGLISSATSLVKEQWQLGDSMVYLTDSTTSASQALGAYYGANKGSKGSLDQTNSALKALADSGMSLSPIMMRLASDAGTLEQATGLGAESWARMAGSLVKTFKASQKEVRSFQSAILSTDLKAGELQHTFDNLLESLHKLQYTFKDGIKGANDFARGYSGAIKVMTKLGIEAQSANKFVNDLLDPDKYEENLKLFGQLGLTTEDYFQALESGKGATAFLDKALNNLPQLARNIAQISSPLQRIRYAKFLGVDMQIASKMARATQGDIESMLESYKQKAVEDKEYQKREEQAKVNAKKYEEALDAFKRQALMPLMAFVSKIMTGSGMQLLSKVSQLTSKVLGKVLLHGAPLIEKVISGFDRILGIMNKDFDKGLKLVGQEIFTYLSKGFEKFAPVIVRVASDFGMKIMGAMIENAPSAMSAVASSFLNALTNLFKTNPVIASLIGVKAGSMVFGGLAGTIKTASAVWKGTKAFLQRNTVGGFQALKEAFLGGGNVEEQQLDVLKQIADNTGSSFSLDPTKKGAGKYDIAGLVKNIFKSPALRTGARLLGAGVGGAMAGYGLYQNFSGVTDARENTSRMQTAGQTQGQDYVDAMDKQLIAESKMRGSTIGTVWGASLGALFSGGTMALVGAGLGEWVGSAVGSSFGRIYVENEKLNEKIIHGNTILQKEFDKFYEEKLLAGEQVTDVEKRNYQEGIMRRKMYLNRMEENDFKYLKRLDEQKAKLSEGEMKRLKDYEKRLSEGAKASSDSQGVAGFANNMLEMGLQKVGVSQNLAEDIGIKFGYWIKYLGSLFTFELERLGLGFKMIGSGLKKAISYIPGTGSLGAEADKELEAQARREAEMKAKGIFGTARESANQYEFDRRRAGFTDIYNEGKGIIQQLKSGDMSGSGRIKDILSRYQEFFTSENDLVRTRAKKNHDDLLLALNKLNNTNEKGNGILGAIKGNTSPKEDSKAPGPTFVSADAFGDISVYRSV